MVQHSKTCISVNEFIAVLKTLKLSEYTTQFNLDGTWTIHYTSPGNAGASRNEDLTNKPAVSSKGTGVSTRAVV